LELRKDVGAALVDGRGKLDGLHGVLMHGIGVEFGCLDLKVMLSLLMITCGVQEAPWLSMLVLEFLWWLGLASFGCNEMERRRLP